MKTLKQLAQASRELDLQGTVLEADSESLAGHLQLNVCQVSLSLQAIIVLLLLQ